MRVRFLPLLFAAALASNGGAQAAELLVDHVNGYYYLTFGPDYANYLDTGRAPVIGQWQHVAATYDGAVARFYIDGVEVASKPWAAQIGTSNAWRIGSSRTDGSRYWDGLIDEARIYDRALPVAEIAADKTESVGPADRSAPTAPTGAPGCPCRSR